MNTTELHVYPDLCSSKPGLYQVSAGYKTISHCAQSAADVLAIVRDIQRGRWWSLSAHVVLVRHGC